MIKLKRHDVLIMVIKENSNNDVKYNMKGSITKYGNKYCNANEQEIINHYTTENDKDVQIGDIQRIDNMIKNINQYIKEIEDNFYGCLYEAEALYDIFKEMKTSEQAMFRAAKIL